MFIFLERVSYLKKATRANADGPKPYASRWSLTVRKSMVPDRAIVDGPLPEDRKIGPTSAAQVEGRLEMYGMARMYGDGQDRPSVIDHLHKNQRAAPHILKVPRKLLRLLSETFYPTESRLICHRDLSKGVPACLLFRM